MRFGSISCDKTSYWILESALGSDIIWRQKNLIMFSEVYLSEMLPAVKITNLINITFNSHISLSFDVAYTLPEIVRAKGIVNDIKMLSLVDF